MKELCRLCCSSSFVQHEIFGPEDDLYARMGTFLFAPLQVQRGDGLPQRVCDACRARILQLHQFCSEAQCVQDRLRALVAEVEVKRELSPEPCWVGVSSLEYSERSTKTEDVLQSEATILTESATQTEQIYFKVEATDVVKQLNTIDEDNTCEPSHTTFVDTIQIKLKSESKRGESPTQYKCKAKWEPLHTFANDQDSDNMNYKHNSNLNELAYQGSYSEDFVQLEDLQEEILVIGSSDSEEHTPLIQLRTKKIKRSAKRKTRKYSARVSNSMKKIKKKRSKKECMELKKKEVDTDSESDGLEELEQFQHGKCKRKSKVRSEDPHACWCCVCSQTMPSRAACLQHYESHLSEGPGPALPLPMPAARVCPRCGKAPSPADWPAHWARHQQRPHYCKLCRHSFAHFHNLVAHGIKYHAKDKQKSNNFMCDLCPSKFVSMMMLERHHNRMHDTDRVMRPRCAHCAYKAPSAIALRMHVNRRHSPRRFLCPHCGKNFVNSHHLRHHLLLHSGEKPYKCQYCDRGFATSTTRRAHEHTHTGEKPHVCGQCSRGFTQRSALMTHVRGVHTRERPYPCPHCGKAFTARNILNAHLKRPCGRADGGTDSD